MYICIVKKFQLTNKKSYSSRQQQVMTLAKPDAAFPPFDISGEDILEMADYCYVSGSHRHFWSNITDESFQLLTPKDKCLGTHCCEMITVNPNFLPL